MIEEFPLSAAGQTNAFEFSRIYGQGWNAAKKLLAAGEGMVDAAAAAAHNPHLRAEERSRWAKGFTEAVASRAGAFTTPGGNSWRPTAARREPAKT
jgi:hypothetical protein